MNREEKARLKSIRDTLANIAIELTEIVREIPEEEPTAEEIDEAIADSVDENVTWTTAAEEAKEGPYLNDLKKLTDLKGLAITGQIKATSDIKTYMKKDKSGIGLIYNVLLTDPSGDLLCVFWDEMVEDAKKFTIGQYIRITNAWKVKPNNKGIMELHPGNYAVIEVVE